MDSMMAIIYDGTLSENSSRLNAIDSFCKKAPSMFHKALIKPELQLSEILSNWIVRETKMLHMDCFNFFDSKRK